MAKFHPHNKLSNADKEEYFIQLCFVLSKTRNIIEAANILKDLLTAQEVEMVGKRLQIADMLMEGFSYNVIKKTLKTSDSTIARVHEWLKLAGNGFRLAKEKLEDYNRKEKQTMISKGSSWSSMKRKYPMYFWPQIILEEIVANSSKKQRMRIKQVLSRMKQKTEFSERVKLLLK
ncbi:MAG: hypothetical protein HY813_03305 [Candidatus Portnoybacteria bacterium]|nr:hypothetical protein [Candidatus Portnoybacteria bacterium]